MRSSDAGSRPDVAWWRAGATDIHRVSDRISTIYVERCHIDRDENAVVMVNRERTVRVPAAMIAAMLVGPGTRITHGAITLLADSGTCVSWVGEHGVRMYAAGLGPARGAQVAQRQAQLVVDKHSRLQVARRMFEMRFPDDDVSEATMSVLRGMEGARVKKLYRYHAKRTGVEWKRREYRAGDAFGAGDDVNRLLSAGNAVLYGVCHAAIVGVGAIPSLGFVHVGNATSFVLDIADLYKAELTIPLAFDLAAEGKTEESDVRYALRDLFAQGRFMKRVVADVLHLIMGDNDVSLDDSHAIWDELLGQVASGHNWSPLSDNEDDYVTISGPVLDSADRPPF